MQNHQHMKQRMPKPLTSRPFVVSLVAGALICAAFTLNAQSGSESYGSIDLGQASASGSTGLLNNDCAPAATANGLSYLYGLDPGAFNNISPDAPATINTLITDMGTTAGTAGSDTGGTSESSALSGVQSYLSTYAPTITASQITENTGPNASTLATSLSTALGNSSAVQLGILWGTFANNPGTFAPSRGGGGHFVSLVSMNLTPSTLAAGTAQMTVLDPWGAATAGSGLNALSTATTVTYDVFLQTLSSGGTVLEVSDPNEYGPADTTSDNGTVTDDFGSFHYAAGYILVADIESVPEPTTMSLLLLPFGAGMLRMLRRNRTP
jgi:hypothetical protein